MSSEDNMLVEMDRIALDPVGYLFQHRHGVR